jgi:chromosomal replication initiator protein
VGNDIVGSNSNKRVFYVSSEKFTIDFVDSIEKNRAIEFSSFYRNVDVLIVDDIQFLSGKERTQDTFFHTFNTLHQLKKQIILSSDSSPRNIPSIEERLRSRFEWGLIADIQPPDLETKVAILRRKADAERLSLPDEVAMFIARQVKTNVRELEGLLNRVLAFSSLTGKPLSLELATETLKDICPGGRHIPPPTSSSTARTTA